MSNADTFNLYKYKFVWMFIMQDYELKLIFKNEEIVLLHIVIGFTFQAREEQRGSLDGRR